MLLSVFGTPSALTYSGCALVRTIADDAIGRHAFIQAIFPADVKSAWQNIDRSETNAVVLFSDFPASSLLELISSSRAPAIVFVDDFEEIIYHALATREMSVAQTLRFASQVVCALDQLRGELVFRVTSQACDRPMMDFVVNACEFFGLREARKISTSVLSRLGYDETVKPTFRAHFRDATPGPITGASFIARIASHDRALIRYVADQYAGIGTGTGRSQIIWPTELFLDWDRPGTLLAGPIDLIGPARFIICGPYLHLPIGAWVARVVVEIHANHSGNRLGVDVFSGTILRGITADLPKSGIFEFSLPFRIEDPFLPAELRFQTLAGAIEGTLTLRHVSFQRSEPHNDLS